MWSTPARRSTIVGLYNTYINNARKTLHEYYILCTVTKPMIAEPASSGNITLPVSSTHASLVGGVDLPTHIESEGLNWFKAVCDVILKSPYRRHKTRVNLGEEATVRVPFDQLPKCFVKYAGNKTYFLPAVLKEMKYCTPKGKDSTGKGMDHEDVLYDPIRVIDIDIRKGQKPATTKQVGILAALLPDSALILSNGCQIYLASSEPWEIEATMLAVIGRFLARKTGLVYDTSTHLRGNGTAANHRNHPYRAPIGACKNGKVRSWLPRSGEMASVRNVFNALGLTFPSENAEESASADTPKKAKEPVSGSMAAQHLEFHKIREALTNLIKNEKLRRAGAEQEILGMKWEHHSRDGLKATLPTVRLISDTAALPDEVWASIRADLAELPCQLGPVSTKRWLRQQTKTVRAIRAWAFEWTYDMTSITCEKAMKLFFSDPRFAKIRQLSIAAIGEPAVREDLRRCWDKWYYPDYKKNPFKKLALVSKATLNLVRSKAKKLGKFKMAEIRKEIMRLSVRQIRQALQQLVIDGDLIPSGNTSGRKYEFVATPMKPTLNNLIVSPNIADKKKVKKPSRSAVSKKPPKAKLSEFPHTSSYVHIKGKDRKSEIKAKLETISLPKLKARLKDVNALWIESSRDPVNDDLSKMLQLENDWLGEVVREKKDELLFAKREAAQARLDAETQEERAEREAEKKAARARSRAGLERMRAGETLGRILERKQQEGITCNDPFTTEEANEFKRHFWDAFNAKAKAKAEAEARGESFDEEGYVAPLTVPTIPESEQIRRMNMEEYFQKRIDSGQDLPLAVGETLLDRVFRFDAKRRENRERARARNRRT